ncbi:helix-turn-helix domain-containing protein [Candidatus Parcubacteria bacterium]|nr:helix-turn-helix domain-containing protein [Candidatus Parcubacteria bacterium]
MMKTAGAILKKAREEAGFSFEEISQVLKIQSKFLQALEQGDWQVFSDPVHIKGFLRNYAEFLGVNPDEVMAFWRREYDETKAGVRSLSALEPIKMTKVVLSPDVVLVAASIVLILSFFGYIYFQYRSFVGAPQLILEHPVQNMTTAKELINVLGKVDKDAKLTINGQEILLNEDGSFAVAVPLVGGINTLNFVAASKLGRETKLTRTVIMEKPYQEPHVAGAESEKEATAPASPSDSEGGQAAPATPAASDGGQAVSDSEERVITE